MTFDAFGSNFEYLCHNFFCSGCKNSYSECQFLAVCECHSLSKPFVSAFTHRQGIILERRTPDELEMDLYACNAGGEYRRPEGAGTGGKGRYDGNQNALAFRDKRPSFCSVRMAGIPDSAAGPADGKRGRAGCENQSGNPSSRNVIRRSPSLILSASGAYSDAEGASFCWRSLSHQSLRFPARDCARNERVQSLRVRRDTGNGSI